MNIGCLICSGRYLWLAVEYKHIKDIKQNREEKYQYKFDIEWYFVHECKFLSNDPVAIEIGSHFANDGYILGKKYQEIVHHIPADLTR